MFDKIKRLLTKRIRAVLDQYEDLVLKLFIIGLLLAVAVVATAKFKAMPVVQNITEAKSALAGILGIYSDLVSWLSFIIFIVLIVVVIALVKGLREQ